MQVIYTYQDLQVSEHKLTHCKKPYAGQEKLAASFLIEALDADHKSKFSMTVRNDIANKAHFPSKETLLKYWLKEIENFNI